MRILDLERKVGLKRATIRFYEKEGLLTPKRQENGYRVYSEEDCDTLLKIKLLRQLGMSLETIKALQQGREDFSTALTEHIQILEERIQVLTRAKSICLELRDAGISYKNLDAAHYLKFLSRPVPNGPSWTPKPVAQFYEHTKTEPHPVRRFIARLVDYLLLICILNLLIYVVLRFRGNGIFYTFIGYLVSYGAWFLLIPINSILLHKWGTTPEKWGMGIHVESCDGGYLTFEQAMAREKEVLRYGIGFGLPGWSYWRMYKSWKQYDADRKLDWDYECEYMYDEWRWNKKAATFVLAGIWLLGTAFTTNDLFKPRYRGSDLTVA